MTMSCGRAPSRGWPPSSFSTREAGLVSGNCDQVRNDGSLWLTLHACFTTWDELVQKPWRFWGRPVMLPAPSTFIRRAALEEVGGFEERDKYAMDYRHWIKLTRRFPVRTVDQTLAVFRCDEGTLSFSANRRQWQETLQISRDYWGSPRGRMFWRFWGSYLRFYQWQRCAGPAGPPAPLRVCIKEWAVETAATSSRNLPSQVRSLGLT